jgi:3'-phosphoadenosine 5'-phosphosulfate sulfotransferase (PAPS reductase)/FAD synthetase
MDKIKLHNALVRVSQACERYGNGVFLGHSGGKDSCVIHSLLKRYKGDTIIVHNTKPMLDEVKDDPIAKLTAMHPETLEFFYRTVARKHHVSMMPAIMMENFVKVNNLTCQIDGARISEAERPGKSSNFIRDGQNVNRKELTPFVENGMFGLTVCYPIYDWTDDDVFDYLIDTEIEVSNEYIENGEIMAYLDRKKNAS